MKNFLKSIPFIIVLFFSFSLQAQTPELDAAVVARLEVLQKEETTSFTPTPFPDFQAKFEADFNKKWSEYQAETLKKIQSAKTPAQVKTIQSGAKTDFSNFAYKVYYELAGEADELYKADLERVAKLETTQKIKADIGKDLESSLRVAKQTIQQAKAKKLEEVK